MDLTDARWFKSSRSGHDGACVEVAIVREGVAVRDTKDRDGGTLAFTHAEWAAFVAGAKSGEFDD
ncbi:DUF397 domain-containing protein [Actinoplanes sp. NPDC051851]|uniref:DUF397 domain-containing protein n=1 Tax=Actinoplanes sp. NPDC051851 TaxID=3154753 RepID=UPI00342FFD33